MPVRRAMPAPRRVLIVEDDAHIAELMGMHLRDEGYQVVHAANDAAGNELLVFARSREGGLMMVAHAPTGGLGSGAGLGSQGAVTLSRDGRFVFVVNAGSNTVSTFGLHGDQLALMSTVDAGGGQACE